MTLIVEDGTGLLDAESYCSVETANAYHEKQGNKGWSGDSLDLEGALRRATQYIDARYRFRGDKAKWDQSLSWPRYIEVTLFSRVTRPSIDYMNRWPVREVVSACAELALKALKGDLYTDESPVSVTKEIIGPLEVDYAAPANGGQVRFAIVDEILKAVTVGGRFTARLERA